jgi:hypothetical protein
MKTAILSAAFAVVSALPLAAATLGEEAGMVINTINDTDFEVIEMGQTLPRGFWCGAASYIEMRNFGSQLTPIYLKSPRGPSVTAPGRMGVVFSTSSDGLPQVGDMLTVDVTTQGQMLEAYKARGFCRDAFTRATK